MNESSRENELQKKPALSGEPSWAAALAIPLCLLGSIIGAGVGVGAFYLALRSGFYGPPLVGVLAGLGARALAWKGGVVNAGIALLIALAASLLAEALFRPFVADDSLGYFFSHLGNLQLISWILYVAGAAAAAFINWPAHN